MYNSFYLPGDTHFGDQDFPFILPYYNLILKRSDVIALNVEKDPRESFPHKTAQTGKKMDLKSHLRLHVH